ncbi:helix-turn-helix domain-containing protein [Halomontanus rarus]|uniref:helix-turn-helix domain-containing protein n=1 Tax=Halomontanus rarus TaxID=3034020 RepID=UPI0023E7CF2B|nr:helix-turn-helix domain-containing protein [Halovivax sp. TS33]
MRKPGKWMENPTDERVLEVLDTGLMLGPTAIAKNIDRSRSWVSRRLSVLVEYGFVVQVEEGYYEIAEPGKEYLEGELDASELDVDDE